MLRRCGICYSPNRGEIESLVKSKIPVMEISKKFHLLEGNSVMVFYNKLRNHLKKNHPPVLANLEPIRPEDVKDGVVEVGFKDYAKKLLTTAMTDPDMFSSKKVSHNAVIAAQRALIDEKKVNTQENALKFAMIKFMRGEAKDGAIEGDTE